MIQTLPPVRGTLTPDRPLADLTWLRVGGPADWLFHWLHHHDGRLLATGEHLLLHVSLGARSSSEPQPHVADKLAELAALHANLPKPDGFGRRVGEKKSV